MTRKAQSDWDCSRSSERTLPEPARIVQEQLLNTTARGIVFHRLFSKVRREVRLDEKRSESGLGAPRTRSRSYNPSD